MPKCVRCTFPEWPRLPAGAALDAARQWKYEPVVVAGEPLPVVMTVTVTFSLGQPD